MSEMGGKPAWRTCWKRVRSAPTSSFAGLKAAPKSRHSFMEVQRRRVRGQFRFRNSPAGRDRESARAVSAATPAVPEFADSRAAVERREMREPVEVVGCLLGGRADDRYVQSAPHHVSDVSERHALFGDPMTKGLLRSL